ncbi:MAG TPA: hypothetical protein VHE08_00050 [Solirubrobacterales bacterium]|nr:hypothetical protein [Solirubrobacterales bacterium]
MWKLAVSLAFALSFATLAIATGADARAKPDGATLTIRSYPKGVYGYLGGTSTTCGEKRKILVFEAQGERRDPRSDPRVAHGLTGSGPAPYQWSATSRRSGPLYAQAPATGRCAAVLSGVAEAPPLEVPGEEDPAGYPSCGSYASESTSQICRLEQIYLDLDAEGPANWCRWGPASGNCPGVGYGPFPWGTSVNFHPKVRMYWSWNGWARNLAVVTYPGEEAGGYPSATLVGTVPDSTSNRFTVIEGYAQNEGAYPSGDRFYTPNLPGQGPGEVGGPLDLSVVNGDWAHSGAEVWIRGYLYLYR